MRILLVGESNIASNIEKKLREYGEVSVVDAKHFNGIPQGTEWVFILDGGAHAGKILSAAGRAKAKAVSIPTSWTHASEKIERAGFFAAVKSRREYGVSTANPFQPKDHGLTQRPFAHVADVLAAQREREANEKKAREATERGINPPPPPPEPAWPFAPAGTEEKEKMAPEPSTVTPGSTLPPPGNEEPDPKRLTKIRKLEWIFEQNPDLSLTDGGKILAGLSADGRAVTWSLISETRKSVRRRLGLDPEVRRYTKIDRVAPGAPVELPAGFTEREEDRAPTSVGSTVPTRTAGHVSLPTGVDSAVRLLAEEVERAPEVGMLVITFKKGDRPRIRWRPDFEVEGDLDL